MDENCKFQFFFLRYSLCQIYYSIHSLLGIPSKTPLKFMKQFVSFSLPLLAKAALHISIEEDQIKSCSLWSRLRLFAKHGGQSKSGCLPVMGTSANPSVCRLRRIDRTCEKAFFFCVKQL